MFSLMVQKELRSVMASSKFSAVFAVSSLLMVLSVYLGIREYTSAAKQYAAANELVSQEMREARQWMALTNRIYREPNPLQIFASGVQNDVGRYSSITSFEPVKLVHSAYNDDPIFAVFRFIDAAFIVQVIFTLLAILFTFDAINGERERGTLQLIFSNAIPRTRYVLAKFTGLWIGLAMPLAVSIAASVGLLFVFGVPMTAGDWARLGMMFGVSVLLCTFFVAFGILVSALTRRSSASFLILLVCWVGFVLIIPRAGVMAAEHLMRVPTAAEIAGRQDAYAKDAWNAMMNRMAGVWREREEAMRALDQAGRSAYRQEHEQTWAEQDEADRRSVQKEIDEHARMLNEEMRNRKAEQERLALNLARLSPVSAHQIAMITLAGTDLSVKTTYEDALASYRRAFNAFKDEKRRSSGASGGIRITFDSEAGLKIDAGRDMALDLSGMPRFQAPQRRMADILLPALGDASILVTETILVLGMMFVAFLRYDVR